METTSLIIVSFACILGLSTVWLLIISGSLKKRNQKMDRQLTLTESDLLRAKDALVQCEKRLAKNLAQHNGAGSHQGELLELRRENAHAKEEIKKIKIDLRIKEGEFKRLEATHIDKLYSLNQEKESLIAQLKELDKTSKVQLEETKQNLKEIEALDQGRQDEKNQLEKQLKFNISKVVTLQEKLRFAEQEIAKLTRELKSKGDSVDPRLVTVWKERAFCAKNMYQMMRQMRALSDNKVESYQDGIIAISEWVLNQTHTPLPAIKENENKADRLLAEAWTAVIAGSYPSAPQNTYEQNLDERI